MRDILCDSSNFALKGPPTKAVPTPCHLAGTHFKLPVHLISVVADPMYRCTYHISPNKTLSIYPFPVRPLYPTPLIIHSRPSPDSHIGPFPQDTPGIWPCPHRLSLAGAHSSCKAASCNPKMAVLPTRSSNSRPATTRQHNSHMGPRCLRCYKCGSNRRRKPIGG